MLKIINRTYIAKGFNLIRQKALYKQKILHGAEKLKHLIRIMIMKRQAKVISEIRNAGTIVTIERAHKIS